MADLMNGAPIRFLASKFFFLLSGFVMSNVQKYLTIKQTTNINNVSLNQGEMAFETSTNSLYLKNGAANILINSSSSSQFFTGMIIAFNGTLAQIPSGWALCDGTNNTPDLRSRFIIGTSSTFPNRSIGGAPNKSLSVAELPAHTHKMSEFNLNVFVNPGAGNLTSNTGQTTPAFVENIASRNTGSTGSGASFSIMNPYMSLYYIMKL